MSAKLVKVEVYKCVCELPNCPGKAKPWFSREKRIPPRCNYCQRRGWHSKMDKRIPKNPQPESIREYNRRKQAESRARLRRNNLGTSS